MAIKTRIGAYQNEEGQLVVQYDGKRADLLELLAFLQAKFLVDITKNPSEYDELAKKIQVATAERYQMLKVEELRTRQAPIEDEPEGESFLGGIIR